VVSVVEVSEISVQFDFMSIEANYGVFLSSSVVPVEFHISNSGFFFSEGNGGLSLSIFTGSSPFFLVVPAPVVFGEIGFRTEKRVFEENVLGSKGSENEFGSETLDLVEFFGANKPEVFVSFDSDAVEGSNGSIFVFMFKFERGLNSTDSSAAFVVFNVVS